MSCLLTAVLRSAPDLLSSEGDSTSTPLEVHIMIIPQAVPGEVLNVCPPGLEGTQTVTLVRLEGLEVTRCAIAARQECPAPRTTGELILVCLEGRVAVSTADDTKEVSAGQLLYLR